MPGEQRPPYAAYAAIMSAFLGGVAGTAALARRLGREPACRDALDYATLAAATFKAARTLSRDRVTSFVREPFVEGEAGGACEEPVHTGGLQQAVGELVSCTRCSGTWCAAGLVSAQVLAPRFGRILTWSLGAASANDFLQAAFVALTSKSNALQRGTGG